MQKVTWEEDVKSLCRLLFDFVNSDYDLVNNKDETVQLLVERYRAVMTNKEENYGDSDSGLLNKLDQYAKETNTKFAIRTPSSIGSSHCWRLSQDKDPGKSSFDNVRDAIRQLIEDVPK